MADETYFGEKLLVPPYQDKRKARRELGFQPAWDEVGIRKSLCLANTDRRSVIEEYKTRLV
ncbi:MAG: hypothetical protein KAY37_00670 [Phycisphaerae bacterium]|nr:hypothetical protein [Phycisphaerae bacterium]